VTDAEQMVRQAVESLEAAWNAGDSCGFAAVFAEDADFINVIGTHRHGRAEIEAGRRQVFDSIYKDGRIKYAVETIRFIRPDAAVALVRTRLTLRGDETITMQTTMMLAKADGNWQIVVYQNTAIAEARGQKRWEEHQ
jgi:uncharacterized protein (TIGR02246 family)